MALDARVATRELRMTDGYRGAGDLLTPLAARVPGLTTALDLELAASQIERTLLHPGGKVHQVTPGTLWYQPDGSCSLRYRVAVSAGTGEVSEHTVVARVYPHDGAGGRTLDTEARQLAPAGNAPVPWGRWTAMITDSDVALSLSPVDPALPTLAAAMNLAGLQDEGWPSTNTTPVSVDLVNHRRSGAAVLRYGVRRTRPFTATFADHIYGKVYPDGTTGDRVHGFLSSLSDRGMPEIPVSLGYAPGLRLGLTAALPGRPILPSMVRAAVLTGADSPASATDGAAAEALRSAGRTLAALHQTRQATAPVRTVDDLGRELDVEIEVVQQVWPRIADQVRSLLDRAATEDDGHGQVLCHGDFTPSQVLLTGRTVSGIVDFDTVCWSDSAMDLGRFLAHLDLLVTKDAGRSAEPVRKQLGDIFMDGYREAMGRGISDRPFLERVSVFRGVSLASTALHACRQLKERRMSLALSLLSPAGLRPANRSPASVGPAHLSRAHLSTATNRIGTTAHEDMV